jgi:hypothetical protein
MKASEIARGRQGAAPQPNPAPNSKREVVRAGLKVLVGGVAIYCGLKALLGQRVV